MLEWLAAPATVSNWFVVALVLMLLVDQFLIGMGYRMQAAWRDLYMRASALIDNDLPNPESE